MPDPLELAYRYLNRRDRTEGEGRRHLAGKGVEDGAVQDAIQMLREQGYVDDARYARLFAEIPDAELAGALVVVDCLRIRVRPS